MLRFGVRRQSPPLSNSHVRAPGLPNTKAEAITSALQADGSHHVGTAFHVGDGVYVTAAYVVRGKQLLDIRHEQEPWETAEAPTSGPFFHPDEAVDVACFTIADTSRPTLPLGGHLDDWINDDAFLLWPTVVID